MNLYYFQLFFLHNYDMYVYFSTLRHILYVITICHKLEKFKNVERANEPFQRFRIENVPFYSIGFAPSGT